MDSSVIMITCVKCTTGNGDFYRLENTKNAGYCPQCFERVIRHKFAFCLGKNRVFRDDLQRDSLLIYLPGHLSSIHLLHFVQMAVSESSDHKRLRINSNVLVILDAVEPRQFELQNKRCRSLITRFPANWQWHFVHEAAVLNSDLQTFNERIQEYAKILNFCKSGTVKEELRRILRTRLIWLVCRELHCRTVLLSDNADTLARDVINALCFGRGHSLADISAMVDTRFDKDEANKIQFVRPLRDISNRELEAIEKLVDKVDELKIPEMETKGELQLLTEEFITSLRDSGFPATVSTILSVANKVESERDGTQCSLCFGRFKQSEDTKDEQKPRITSNCSTICHPCLALTEELVEPGRTLLFSKVPKSPYNITLE